MQLLCICGSDLDSLSSERSEFQFHPVKVHKVQIFSAQTSLFGLKGDIIIIDNSYM